MNDQNRLALPIGTTINQYRIEEVLGYGGFGIVYKARHQLLDQAVAIKEYLPQEIATRDASTVHPLSSKEQILFEEGRQRFLAEAKQLLLFDQHPNIVRCRDFFEFNGTAYLVMNFEDGLPLSELLKQYESKNKKLSEQQILELILPLLDGLKTIHEAGVLHRDIKPGNIFIRRSDQQPVLIDFGAAKQNFSQHSKSMAPYSPGYAAIEQIEEEGNLGPWTDIYATGAVMWRMISGRNPDQVEKRTNAIIRGKEDPMQSALKLCQDRYTNSFGEVINKCIALREEDRYQTAKDVVTALSGEGQIETNATKNRQPAKNTNIPINSKLVAFTDNKVFAARFKLSTKSLIFFAVTAIVVGIVYSGFSYTKAVRVNQLVGNLATIPEGSFNYTHGGESNKKINVEKFRIGEKEITRGQFKQFILATGYITDAEKNSGSPGCYSGKNNQLIEWGWVPEVNWRNAGVYNIFQGDDHPVLCVSWHDVKNYIDWLNEETGEGFRLPSQIEWEFAARAGSNYAYYFGNDSKDICHYGNIADTTSKDKYRSLADLAICSDEVVFTAPVGSYEPNGFNVYDMIGNVWEWTDSCVLYSPENESTVVLDVDESSCAFRVVKGGAWNLGPAQADHNQNFETTGDNRTINIGFRLAQDL